MLKVLLEGFGYSATTFHLPFLTTIEGFDVVGVVSSRTQEIQHILPEAQVFENLDDALRSVKPDLTIITTPNHLHFPHAEACLQTDSHVLVEKPFTLTVENALSLVSLAQKKNKTLSVFQNRRLDGDFLTVQKLIQEQRVGQLRRFVSRFDRFRPEPRDRWRENKGPGSGIFWDLAPHLIDQALQLFGLPLTVSGHLLKLRNNSETTDTFSLFFHYHEFIVELGSSPFQAASVLRYELQGDKGSYRKYALDPQEAQLKEGRDWRDSAWAVTPAEEDGILMIDEGSTAVHTEQGRYQDFFIQLREAINADKPAPGDASSVINTIRIMQKVSELAEHSDPFIFHLENVIHN